MESLQIVTLNVRGLRNVRKRKNMFSFLRGKKYDIICLQETYIVKEDCELWKKEWGGDLVYCEGTKHGRGQIILIRKQFPFDWKVEKMHDRILALTVTLDENNLTIFNVYAPSTNNDVTSFIAHLSEKVNECHSFFKMVCGDFNTVIDNKLDIISGEKHLSSLVKSFNKFKDECSLTDVWRSFNPETKEYTWSRKSIGAFVARRLDYIFLNDNAMNKASETNIFSVATSDHRGVYVNLKCTDSSRGPGYYKFNNTLLRDKIYVEKMNGFIDTCLVNLVNENPQQKWELLKLKIKEETMQYSKYRSMKTKNNNLQKIHQLNNIEAQLSQDPNSNELQRKRDNLKLEQEIYEQERFKSAQTRARVKWIQEGEKNTKYFLNLEKTRANAKLFPSIVLDSGVTVTNQHEILNAQRNYYTHLYSNSNEPNNSNNHNDTIPNRLEEFLQGCDKPKLTEEEKENCEGNITINEATTALKGMKNGSSPGQDGLTTEFLKFFWLKLRDTLVESFNYSFEQGSLSYTQSSAVIILLHKGKDLPKNKLENWRPISLTCSDYKVLAKCLAIRLGKVLTKIVHEDQVGYVKGRNVSTIIRTIDDVIDYCKLNNKPGILLALDFQKAFDSISKEYMIYAFKTFGFGKQFIQWVKVLFSETKSCMLYNGWLSEQFEVNKGVKQGCPFSPLAFIIGLELLAIRIRQSADISGIKIGVESIIKLVLYADDITAFVRDQKDARMLLLIFDEFSMISGLKLNKQKSESMGIGCRKNDIYKIGVKSVKEVKILGIYFNSAKTASEINKNWTTKIIKIKSIINGWEKRNLGLLGKVCVIKTFILSQFIYLMQCICIPDKVLREINTLMYRFLWRKQNCNKKAFEKVKRVVVNSSYEKGGLEMIDVKSVQTSFLCQWLTKLSASDISEKWTCVPRECLHIFGEKLECLNSTIGPSNFKGLNKIKSLFWKSAISAWLTYNKINTHQRCRSSCIWNNTHIRYQGNVIFFENWIKSGLISVHDLLTENNVFKSFSVIENTVSPSPELYMQYIVVRSAIMSCIKRGTINLLHVNNPTNSLLFNDKNFDKAKQFRYFIVDSLYSPPCSTRFWLTKFNTDINDKWLIARTVSKESRLSEIHWKILHNIYPTKVLLLKMGLSDTDLCLDCLKIDYVEHFFFECKKIRPLWKHIEKVYFGKFGASVHLTATDVLCGITSLTNTDSLPYLNHLILIGKVCISKFRYGTPIDITCMFEREVWLRMYNG